jgi:hypothetical protein
MKIYFEGWWGVFVIGLGVTVCCYCCMVSIYSYFEGLWGVVGLTASCCPYVCVVNCILVWSLSHSPWPWKCHREFQLPEVQWGATWCPLYFFSVGLWLRVVTVLWVVTVMWVVTVLKYSGQGAVTWFPFSVFFWDSRTLWVVTVLKSGGLLRDIRCHFLGWTLGGCGLLQS